MAYLVYWKRSALHFQEFYFQVAETVLEIRQIFEYGIGLKVLRDAKRWRAHQLLFRVFD
jgi:hypothetical protein